MARARQRGRECPAWRWPLDDRGTCALDVVVIGISVLAIGAWCAGNAAGFGRCASGGFGEGPMRRFQVGMVLPGAVAVVVCTAPLAVAGAEEAGAAPAAVAVTQAGTWGKAIEVPGLAALNQGGAQVLSVSCPAAGNCAAGGFYLDSSQHGQGFVVSERNGAWGKAIEVPGLGALNKGGNAQVRSVSCPSAGNCAAGGFYLDSSQHGQGFVVSERNGTWGKAIEVPGLGALNKGGDAQVRSVSCPSAGDCAAGRVYFGQSQNTPRVLGCAQEQD